MTVSSTSTMRIMIPCCSRTARAETRGRSRIDWPAAERERAAQSQHGLVTRQQVDLLRAWRRARREPPGQRDGRLAGSALGRIAGATDLPEPDVTFLAMLDQDTLVFIAPGRMGSDRGSGPWMSGSSELGQVVGAERVVPRRIPTGTQQFTSVSASRDRGPVVATKANSTASLWRLPILGDRQATEDDVVPVRVQTERALAPRYARRAESPLLFFLSARGTGDRVWGFKEDGVRDHEGRGRTPVRDTGAGA